MAKARRKVENMVYRDRVDAGMRLATALAHLRGRHPLVMAIPRGGVPLGAVVAERLGGDLDLVLTRKLGAPGNPEFAVGAVDETGWMFVADYAREAGATPAYLEQEKARQMATMRARRAHYTPGRAPMSAAGRVTIVVDDGLATGATMIAALHALRAQRPARLVCAVPVAAPDAVTKVRAYADEVVCPHVAADFHAVGQFYLAFPQVGDGEVIALMRAATDGGGIAR
jgi:putative phosphoribosyl transferase